MGAHFLSSDHRSLSSTHVLPARETGAAVSWLVAATERILVGALSHIDDRESDCRITSNFHGVEKNRSFRMEF